MCKRSRRMRAIASPWSWEGGQPALFWYTLRYFGVREIIPQKIFRASRNKRQSEKIPHPVGIDWDTWETLSFIDFRYTSSLRTQNMNSLRTPYDLGLNKTFPAYFSPEHGCVHRKKLIKKQVCTALFEKLEDQTKTIWSDLCKRKNQRGWRKPWKIWWAREADHLFWFEKNRCVSRTPLAFKSAYRSGMMARNCKRPRFNSLSPWSRALTRMQRKKCVRGQKLGRTG